MRGAVLTGCSMRCDFAEEGQRSAVAQLALATPLRHAQEAKCHALTTFDYCFGLWTD